MATKSMAKVTVDNAGRKRSGFDLGGRLSTSFQFGEVLPVHCRKLIANSSHTVGTRSLVRLDPMVAPTSQGRMTVKMWHSFIGLSDLFRNVSAFLTGKTVSGSNGLINFSKLPSASLCELSALCLVGARVSVWTDPVTNADGSVSWTRYSDNTSISSLYNDYFAFNFYNPVTSASGDSLFESRFPNYTSVGDNYRYRVFDLFGINYSTTSNGIAYLPLGNDSVGSFSDRTFFLGAPEVDIAHCDFVFYRSLQNSSSVSKDFAFAVNMSNYGARLYDILTVLGFGVDFANYEYIDITRLFAYYLSYYGSFGLSLYTNYESSNCSRLLKAYENGGNGFNVIGLGSGTNASVFGNQWYLNDLFVNFITDLCTGYVTEPVDYISAHRRTDVISNIDDIGWVHNIVVSAPNLVNPDGAFAQNNVPYPGGIKQSTNAIFINQVSHTQVDADLLKMLWKNSNRQSVAGQELEKLLRAGGYGAYVDQQQSHFLGYTEYDIDVSDINATSDSVNTVTGRGSTLGQYVGKGIGAQKDDKTFSYDTDEAGYWIILAAIVPDSSYCQGNDQTVYDIERTDQYQPDFDSMGYEMERKAVLKVGADVLWAANTSSSQDPFGFVPRFMRYKVGRSILAGNFRRRSTRDQYLPFVLSRWLDVDDLYESAARSSTANSETVTLKSTQSLLSVPVAGNAWRYINLYPWLSNFERIFAFDEKVRGAWETQQKFERYVYCGERYDYFMLFMNIMHKCNAPMLPASDSWSTTDDNDGNGTTMTQS